MENNNKITGYDLSRNFIDFSFENPSKIKPNHYALYFFAIEHCNRLGWKKEFGLPTTMTMEAIGIRSYNTYINTFTDLESFGFIKVIEKSKNQYSSNIIALSNFDKALDKALDKAFIKHNAKQSESTKQSISSIDKQSNQEQINQSTNNKETILPNKNSAEEILRDVRIIPVYNLDNELNGFGGKIKNNKIDFDQVKDIFNSVCVNLPKVKVITKKREGMITARAEEYSLEIIGDVLVKASKSDFLNGKVREWSANFDWIFNPTNFLKILEDNYLNKTVSKEQTINRQSMETINNNAKGW